MLNQGFFNGFKTISNPEWAGIWPQTDYTSFGSPMVARVYEADTAVDYRFGFNGKENDSETETQDYGFRIYNPGLGKFLTVDPMAPFYPWYTPYQFAGNSPILYIDLDGLEPAPAKSNQVKAALKQISDFKLVKNVKIVFAIANKIALCDNLESVVNNPGKSIVTTGGNYCGLYAFTYVFATYDPEAFTKGVLELAVKGESTINGQKIKASEKLKKAKVLGHSSSVFILSASLRETENNYISYDGTRYWNSTSAGTMKNWLQDIANLEVTMFSYGHEYIADGVTNPDLQKVVDHVNNGNMAVLFLCGDQFNRGSGKSGAGSDLTGGDHFVVLDGPIALINNGQDIKFTGYDQKNGKQEYTWNKQEFMDMINEVLLVKKKSK